MTLPHANRVHFAQFIARALSNARATGMTDRDIKRATGINPSTFHHWQSGETVPKFATLQQFCKGLGLDVEAAMATLRTDVRQTEPDPPMDPDVLKLLRRLANPNTSNEIKLQIRATLRYLNDLPEPAPARSARRRRAS